MSSRSSSSERERARLWVVPKPDAGIPRPRLPAPTLDDSQLLASVRAGDPDAASALHDRLRPVVERAIRRLLGRRDRDHEDLTQQVMIEVVYTIDRFRGDCPLDAWASTVAAHVVYNHIRRRTTERRIFDAGRFVDSHEGGDGNDGNDSAPASLRSLTRDTAARSTLKRVMIHLDAIDEVKAWTYVLHDVCGYDLREVAQITESSVAAAQSRLVRGRRELRERLAADPELAPMLSEKDKGNDR